jgi:hypothetical protein
LSSTYVVFHESIPRNMIFRKSLPVVFTGFILCLVSLILPSCTHDPAGIDNLDPVCFDTQVMPILVSSCLKCHDGSTEGFTMGNYTEVMKYVTAGDPRNSKLYQSITDINGENLMPPDHPLSQDNRTIIEVWIAQGAPDLKCSTDTTSGSGGGDGGNLKSCSDSIYFAQKILPLITSNCAWCHDGKSHGEEDNLFHLDSYETIRQYVNPSDPSSSKLYRVLSENGEDLMPPPPNPTINNADKAMLLTWITEGAMNNSCTVGICDTTGAITYTSQIVPIIQHNCIGCHTPPYNQGGIDLTGYTQVKALAETLRPNSPDGIPVIIGAVRRVAGFKSMPTTYALDECSIRTIELWIAQGLNQ